MLKRLLTVLALIMLQGTQVLAQDHGLVDNSERWNKTTAITGLSFCAFILRDFHDRKRGVRELYVLTAPEEVTENNLSVLFRVISAGFPKAESLEVWVYTDVEQLDVLATGQLATVAPSREQAEAAEKQTADRPHRGVKQLAYYKRTKEAELFRYNPDYPGPGEKTVVVRRKED